MRDELWKPVIGYEGIFEVSDKGNLKRLLENGKERILKGYENCNGYRATVLCVNHVPKSKLIHRLVAEAFIPNPDNLPQINHIDGNKKNNSVENLEWCDSKHNINHAWSNGLHRIPNGTNNPRHKLTEDQINYIRKNCVRYDQNRGTSALARKFGVSQTTISRIVRGETWKIFDA